MFSKNNRFESALKNIGAGNEIINAGKLDQKEDNDVVVTHKIKDEVIVKKIDIDNMVPNNANIIYSISNIDDLAENIKENGLLHNIVLRMLNNGFYRIISGHRRREALKVLVERDGLIEFKHPFCTIRNDIDNDLNEELALHKAAFNDRELSDMEKAKQAKRLQEIYNKKKMRGDKIIGKITDNIGTEMGISGKQVQRYIEINDKLIPDMQQLIDEGIVSGSTALEFKNRSDEEQKLIVESIKMAYNQGIELTRENAKNINKKLNSNIENLEERLNELQKELENANMTVENAKFEKEKLKKKYKLELEKKIEQDKNLKQKIKNMELDSKILSDTEENGVSIKGNIELNIMLSQCKTLVDLISERLKEYSNYDNFLLSEINEKLLLNIKDCSNDI